MEDDDVAVVRLACGETLFFEHSLFNMLPNELIAMIFEGLGQCTICDVVDTYKLHICYAYKQVHQVLMCPKCVQRESIY